MLCDLCSGTLVQLHVWTTARDSEYSLELGDMGRVIALTHIRERSLCQCMCMHTQHCMICECESGRLQDSLRTSTWLRCALKDRALFCFAVSRLASRSGSA